MVDWKVSKIINYQQEKLWGEGYAQFGFHDLLGNKYFINNEENWLALLEGDDFAFTAGPKKITNKCPHIFAELKDPKYLCGCPHTTGSVLVSSEDAIFRINPNKNTSEAVITTKKNGIRDIGNCVYDSEGNIWVNEIRGYKIWQFDYNGNLIRVLGNGRPGFQRKPTSFDEVQFNWVYDLRSGLDGNIYVLDSKNFCVRMIDIRNQVVELIAGTGDSDYTGDWGDPLKATFGSNPKADFDGPWSLSLDEENNIYIGDTQNHVVRMIERKNNIIKTIAGKHNCNVGVRNDKRETNPLNLNLPLICSLDYYDGKLFIPEWDGDLVIIEKEESNPIR